MNDEQRQKLTAYLDGALPAAEAAAFELEIAKSPELLAELEEQRAVSKMLKDLPREKLPVGFMQRLQRRREAPDAAPAREWVLLPPGLRPVAAALSGLIVAVVVWDKVGERPLPVLPYEHAAVKSAADAPPVQFDLAKNLAPASGAARDAGSGGSADKKESAGGFAATEAPGFHPPSVEIPEDQARAAIVARRERARAKGRPIEADADEAAAASASSMMDAAKPAAPPAAAPEPRDLFQRAGAAAEGKVAAARGAASPRTMAPAAMSEEERSARNEEIHQRLEQEKRKMGIAGFAAKSDDRAQRVLAAAEGAAPARIDSMTPNLLGAKDGVLPRALRSESAYRDAWTALKLAGDPLPVDFAKDMVVVLPQPGTVLSAVESARELVVTWKPAPKAGAAARLCVLPLSGRAVRLVRQD